MRRIDIVLPVYNPLPGWEVIVIQRYRSLCARLEAMDFSLTVVNDGSSRLEVAAKESLQAQLPQMQWIEYETNRGKGYALRQGIQHTSGDWIVFTDIDWPYTEDSMVRLIQTLSDGADVAIGVRDEDYYKHLPPMRMRISKWLRAFNGRLLKLKVNDTQAGLKGFHSLYKPVFMKTTIDRYLFDLEFIYRLSKIREIRMVSVPIKLREGITFSTMNRKILMQETMNFLKVLISR
jgi:glycosyltransferase involved in cell wall biosynthesis